MSHDEELIRDACTVQALISNVGLGIAFLYYLNTSNAFNALGIIGLTTLVQYFMGDIWKLLIRT